MERKRTSKKQFKIYVDYMKSHRILLTGKLSPSSNPENIDLLWEKLTNDLNSCGDGPVRDIHAWKKVFTEWKGVCRKKARENKALSDLEAQIIELTGRGAITGLDLGEMGFSQSCKRDSSPADTSHTLHPQEKEISEEETDPTSPTEIQKKPTDTPAKNKKIKFKRTRNSDILSQTYESAVNRMGEKMGDISLAILEVAKAINHYCDIVENNVETVFIDPE